MKPPALPLAVALAVALCPAAAHAGATACWFEAGVVVVPAEVMGVAGDFVLDTGSAHTLLAETQAQGAGFADTALTGSVRLAGIELSNQPVAVAALDARLRNLPTPVAGIIGADVLGGYVLDVSFSPCRVALNAPSHAPRFGGERTLPLQLLEGRPAVQAAVTDGARTTAGTFLLATGGDTAVRLRDDLAGAPGAAKREGLYPTGELRPRLRALSFAGDLFENLPAGLLAAAGSPAVGEIGAPTLAHYRLRFDFPRRQLVLAKEVGAKEVGTKEKGPPDRSDGP